MRAYTITCARAFLATFSLVAMFVASPGPAQTQDQEKESEPQIEVEADDGIEWQRDKKVVVARGNAHAVRGTFDVRADMLSAHYRDDDDGNAEIWLLEADGNVVITSPTETAYGQKGVYDVDEEVLVLSGGDKVRLLSEGTEITAEKQLQFWPKKDILVATGNASAVQKDQRLDGEKLTILFKKDENGKSQVAQIEAEDNVRVTTADEIVKGDSGVYNLESGIATLTGSVKITRGPNQINGCRGEVDMNAGVSKVFSCGKASSGSSRVKGLIHPDSVEKN
jgi:lipopolysaccharide export system protein LptA